MDFERINERLDQMIDNMIDDDFLEIEIKNKIREKMFLYQLLHLRTLLCALKREKVIVDGSETGTGKTYTTMAVAAQNNYQLMVVCPKTMTYCWEKVAKIFEVPIVSITNYEMLRNGKELIPGEKGSWELVQSNRVRPILNKEKDEVTGYHWKIHRNLLVVFDEVHRCKNGKTLNGKLLLGCRQSKDFKGKLMMLSATMADKPENFHIFGYMLGLYEKLSQGKNWITGTLREDKRNQSRAMSHVHQSIYPTKGSRMMVSELGSQFPQHTVSADCYRLKAKDSFAYQKYMGQMEQLYGITENEHQLAKITKLRVQMERLKAPVMVSLAQSYLETDCSVVIFVNFTETLRLIAEALGTKSVIYGAQDRETRKRVIEDFQEDRSRIIICNMRAGGEGISLHDTKGKYRRVSLISPSFSCQELIQSLGRIVRAGAKTPTLQKIVFLAGTIEESIANHLQEKLTFSQKINNQDLAPFTVDPGVSLVCNYNEMTNKTTQQKIQRKKKSEKPKQRHRSTKITKLIKESKRKNKNGQKKNLDLSPELRLVGEKSKPKLRVKSKESFEALSEKKQKQKHKDKPKTRKKKSVIRLHDYDYPSDRSSQRKDRSKTGKKSIKPKKRKIIIDF